MIGTCIDCLANCPAAGFYRLGTWKCVNYVTAEMLPKKTNADRVREMSDEELATWLGDMLGVYPFGTEQWDRQAWLDWLKKEVEE